MGCLRARETQHGAHILRELVRSKRARPMLERGRRDEEQHDPADNLERAVNTFEGDAHLERPVEHARTPIAAAPES